MFRIQLILAFFISFSAFAETFNVDKFKARAIEECQSLLDPQLLLDEWQLYFKDGASQLDQPYIADEATYFYGTRVRKDWVPVENLYFGYRLVLTGKHEPVFFILSDSGELIDIAEPRNLLALLYDGVEKEVQSLLDDIENQLPNTEIEYKSHLGFLNIHSTIEEFPKVFEILGKYPKLVELVQMSTQKWILPIEFDEMKKLSDSGVIDPDRHRTVTNRLKREGRIFQTKTTIPAEFW